MSAKNVQSDTSRVVVKNPLLSGIAGSIDDFVNNSILLPAAEIPATVLPPTLAECHEPDNRDSTKSVIYGTESAVLDSDKFSEISLDQSVDAEQQYSVPPAHDYNPLQNLDTFSAPTFEEQQRSHQYREESPFNPLAQATAIKDSLSQLPGVASSVLSSFSSILKGTTSNPSTDIGSNFQAQYQEADRSYQCFYDPTTIVQQQQSTEQSAELAPLVAPTFYSPSDPSLLVRPEASLSPSSVQSNNTYRLKERKKQYAPIPGLNANITNIPPNLNASPSPAFVQSAQPIQPHIPSVDYNQPKPANSFSLSSFFGAPLLDKIQSTVLPRESETPQTYNTDFGDNLEQLSVTSFGSVPSADISSSQPLPVPQPFHPNQFNTSLPSQLPSQQVQNASVLNNPTSVLSNQPPALSTFFNPVLSSAPLNTAQQLPFAQSQSNYNQFPRVPSPQSDSNFSAPPSASISPALSQHSIPSAYLPPSQISTLPPSGQSQPLSYRLQGKAHYKKPTQSFFAEYNRPSAQVVPSPAIPQAAAAQNVHIFNPIGTEIPNPSVPQSNQESLILGQSQQPQSKPVNLYNRQATIPSQASLTSAATQEVHPPPLNFFNPQQFNSPSALNQPEFGQNIAPVGIFNPSPIVLHEALGNPPKILLPPIEPIPSQIQPEQVLTPPANVTNPQQFSSQSFSHPEKAISPQNIPISAANLQFIPNHKQTVAPVNIFSARSDASSQVNFLAGPSQEIFYAKLEPEKILTPPASVFNPQSFSPSPQPSLSLVSEPPKAPTNIIEHSQAASSFHQYISSPVSSPSTFFNPFSAAQDIVPTNSATNIQTQPAHQLNSFFGGSTAQPIQSLVLQSDAPIQTLTPQVPISPVFESVAQEKPNNNFFDSTSLNPFEQQNDLNTVELTAQSESNIITDLQNLTIDKENKDSLETTPDNKEETIEAEPISLFNNSFIESPNDQLSVETINYSESTAANEFTVQSFFNDPPLLTEVQENVQDSNYSLIRTNVLNKRIERIAQAENRLAGQDSSETLSIASVIVEPPSSAQSEISEYVSEPQPADVTSQSIPESLQSTQDQTDGINIFNWLDKQEKDDIISNMASNEQSSTLIPTTTTTNIVYRPVYKHWFYKTTGESKRFWIPFSFNDSMLLEEAFTQQDREIVTTDGGRFDVNIPKRTRNAVYWTAESNEVRRCSWFYKGVDFRLIPYEEQVAEELEEEYRIASNTGEWQRKIPLKCGDTVVFNGPSDIIHILKSQSSDGWNSPTQNGEMRPRAVKRGTDEFTIEDGEPEQIDHLLFMIHGIGSACDLKFRKVEEVVDEFRMIALQLVQSHYRSSCDRGLVGRVEVLPISWHSELHSEESGIDEKLKAITLESIPKLRNFTNDTLLDILFYTSPVFCQQIIDAVSGNMNRCYAKFLERNPKFNGNISVSGHSLGSVILFDLLQHQRDEMENSENLENATKAKAPLKRHCSQQIDYTIGHAGTGQPYISYPQLNFQPKHFFALGSPIGMFVTIRGIDALGLDFKLPTCEHFFNIFHPYDPVAYRIEALVNSELTAMRPVLVPHHKGRKRMHLELRETVARVGADIKHKIMQTLKTTLDTVYSYTSMHRNPRDTKAIQQEVDKVITEQLTLDELETSANASCASSEIDTAETDLALGKFNAGKRIDYVLQEAPLEIINEYLFALTSHVCYWGSEDATLFIMKEIYSSLGIQADSKIPQPTMTIERPSPANSVKSSPIS